MDRVALNRRLEFYRDLGIKTLWSGPSAGSASSQPETAAEPPPVALPATETTANALAPQNQRIVPIQVNSPLPPMLPEDDNLERIVQDMGDCTRCRLGRTRQRIVFGSGNPEARLVFVGEGPGADEDEQGLPFVGRAGQLLTQMIDNTAAREGLAIRRPDVYICNVIKCRPPENRTPEADEMEVCGQFLFRQIMVIRPKAIVALGGTAAKALLDLKTGITKARGQWHAWRDIPVMPTYHPSYLLRPYNQNAKRECWEDLKKVLHFVYD
ncbi:MAG: uracil-DNA glycosylase [Candidatus Solibacter sp.]|nr:uracil-DNA glycosylase [Candidatus Solibacter sp.]